MNRSRRSGGEEKASHRERNSVSSLYRLTNVFLRTFGFHRFSLAGYGTIRNTDFGCPIRRISKRRPCCSARKKDLPLQSRVGAETWCGESTTEENPGGSSCGIEISQTSLHQKPNHSMYIQLVVRLARIHDEMQLRLPKWNVCFNFGRGCEFWTGVTQAVYARTLGHWRRQHGAPLLDFRKVQRKAKKSPAQHLRPSAMQNAQVPSKTSKDGTDLSDKSVSAHHVSSCVVRQTGRVECLTHVFVQVQNSISRVALQAGVSNVNCSEGVLEQHFAPRFVC